jgi:hypothetical protein
MRINKRNMLVTRRAHKTERSRHLADGDTGFDLDRVVVVSKNGIWHDEPKAAVSS